MPGLVIPGPDSKFQCRPKYPIFPDYPSNFVSFLEGFLLRRELSGKWAVLLQLDTSSRLPQEESRRAGSGGLTLRSRAIYRLVSSPGRNTPDREHGQLS